MTEQKLLLLMKRVERINGKRYLRLVALDYIKGNILTLYDEDGDSATILHSWNKETNSLREMSVIRASYFFDNKQEYAAKATSGFETISEGGNLKHFLKKIYIQSLLSVIEGESNLPFPVSKPDILENADNISIDQSFYNSEMPTRVEEEDMIFDAYWHYDEDEDAGLEEYTISEDDNLSFDWSFDNEKQISFREGEYQLVDVRGAVYEEKYLSLRDIKIFISDEKIIKSPDQGRYFNGFALIRRAGESFTADRLYGKFEKKKKPPYVEELESEFQQLEEKILMVATRIDQDDEYMNSDEVQYSADYELNEEEGRESEKHKAILTGIAGYYPAYSVTDRYADDFATEYGTAGESGKKKGKPVKTIM